MVKDTLRFVKTVRLLILLAFSPTLAGADTVVLQTGDTLEVEKSWFSKGRVYFLMDGLEMSIPKRYVKGIEGPTTDTNRPLAEQLSKKSASAPTTSNDGLRQAGTGQEDQVSYPRERLGTDAGSAPGNVFRDLNWGDRLCDIPGMEDLETQSGLDGVKEYVRPTDVLKLGQARLSSIVYAFWRDRLYTVSIWTQGLPNYMALRRELFQRYGQKDSGGLSPQAWYWSTGPTDMLLEYQDEEQYGLFWMRSRELDRELKRLTFDHQLTYLKWMRSVKPKDQRQALPGWD